MSTCITAVVLSNRNWKEVKRKTRSMVRGALQQFTQGKLAVWPQAVHER